MATSRINLFIGCPRVSSDAQADEGFSLETQENALRAYGEKLGAKRILIFPDDISGSVPIRERPGGKELYKYIDKRTPGLAVGWYKVSRISRDDDIVEMPLLMRDLRRIGAEFHLVDRGRINLDDHFSKAVLFFESASAAKDNSDRTEATARGRRAKAASGAIVGSGATPYHIDKVGEGRRADYVLNKARAAVIRKAVRWVIAGKSLEQCCVDLGDMGAETPGARLGRRSAGWYSTTLIVMLRSPALAGKIKFGDTLTQRDDLRVVDDETFAQLQTRLDRLKWDNPRDAKRFYLLRGRVICSCGRVMVGQPGGPSPHQLRYYRCPTNTARLAEPCGAFMVRADGAGGIEALAWAEVVGFITSPDRLREAVVDHNTQQLAARDPLAGELSEATAAAAKAARAYERVRAALASTDDEDAAAVLGAELVQMATARAAADRRVEELRAANVPVQLLDADEVLAQVAKVAKRIKNAEGEQRLPYLDALGVECHIIEGNPRRVRVAFTELLETAEVVIDLPRNR